jgi:hypothetical protein
MQHSLDALHCRKCTRLKGQVILVTEHQTTAAYGGRADIAPRFMIPVSAWLGMVSFMALRPHSTTPQRWSQREDEQKSIIGLLVRSVYRRGGGSGCCP